MTKNTEVYEEQKALVLERFKTLDPNSKITLGDNKELSVKDLIAHIKSDDEMGKNLVNVQIKMLQILSNN